METFLAGDYAPVRVAHRGEEVVVDWHDRSGRPTVDRGAEEAAAWTPPPATGAPSPPGRADPVNRLSGRDGDPGAAAARRERVEREEPLHRLGRRRPDRQGRGRGRARRRAAARGRAAARRGAHLAAAPGDPHRRARAGRRRPALDPGAPVLAAERAPLRRAAGQGQGGDAARSTATSSSCSGAAPTTCRRRRSTDDGECRQAGDPRYADLLPRRLPAHRVPGRRACDRMLPYWYDAIVPDLRPAGRCWSPRTATRCGRWSSTSTGIGDDEVVGLNIPTGIPLLLRARRRRCSRHGRR